jgi:hypothetical protein
MAQEPDDFANLEDVEDAGGSDFGSRRLTDLSAKVIEATRDGWLAWLVAALVLAGSIVGGTWLLGLKIPRLEEAAALAQAELTVARQDKQRLEQELGTSRGQIAELEHSRDALTAEVERLKSNPSPAAAPAPEPKEKKKAAKKSRKKRGGRR